MLISISGVDGSGKSTQLQALAHGLEQRGHRVRTLWYRPGYSDTLNRLRAALRRARPAALPSPGDPARRAQVFARRPVAEAWVAAALGDMFVQYALGVRRALATGETVLADRYVADGLLDLDLRFPALGVSARPLARAVAWACPRPDVALLLWLPWEDAQTRLATKVEPFPDPPELRARRYQAYARLAASGQFAVIDARGSLAAVQTLIRRHVGLDAAPGETPTET